MEKLVVLVVLNISIIVIAINNIKYKFEIKNTMDDILLDGRLSINIIKEKLKTKLGLPKPKPTPYNLILANRTTTKPMGSSMY